MTLEAVAEVASSGTCAGPVGARRVEPRRAALAQDCLPRLPRIAESLPGL